MFKLNNEFLKDIGLGELPPAEKNMMLRHIYETLELRVGMKLAEQMSPKQLDDFEQLMPKPDDTQDSKLSKEKQALSWLETNFPDYKQVVSNELDKLKNEISQSAPQILQASRAAAEQQNQN